MTPTLYASLTEAIQDLTKRGFTAQFKFLDQAFQDVKTGKIFNAEDLTIVERYGFQGTSDLDDTSVVYALESEDGTRGTACRSLLFGWS
jgi:hypothetical protein